MSQIDNKFSSFELKNGPFGNEIELRWEFEIPLENHHKVIVFRRENADVKKEEIDKYLKNPTSEGVSEGLWIFFQIPDYQNYLSDGKVNEGKTYYYRIIIVDKNDFTKRSVIAAAHLEATGFNAIVNAVDSKKTVIDSLEIIMRVLSNKLGSKVPIPIYGDFPVVEPPPVWITVTRAAGDNAYKYWSNVGEKYGGGIIRGDMDTDVLQVVWECKENPGLRDKLSIVFKGVKFLIERKLKKLEGVIDAKCTMAGDGADKQYEPAIPYGMMLINVIVENYLISGTEGDLITLLNHEFRFNIEQ